MKAIFAGTFDPFTLGHKNIVERALGVFGEVTIAVAVETGKNCATLNERVDVAVKSTCDLVGVTVCSFDGLLTDYIKQTGEKCVLVRGVRSVKDTEYERDLTRSYEKLCGVKTVFIMPDAEYEHISSSAVRTIAALGGDISTFAAPNAIGDIMRIYGKAE